MKTPTEFQNGAGKLDFWRLVRFLLPILAVFFLAWLLVKGYVMTPEAREDCIKRIVREEICVFSDALERHIRDGHPVEAERLKNLSENMHRIEAEIQDMKNEVRTQSRTLARIEAKMGD